MRSSAAGEPRGRDVPPTGVRLPPDLRDRLTREAAINGRSLSAEIINRLQASMSGAPTSGRAAQEAAPTYSQPALDDSQRLLLTLFSAMPPERQLALLTLLRR